MDVVASVLWSSELSAGSGLAQW